MCEVPESGSCIAQEPGPILRQPICEAVTRPTMRFVPVKSAARQGALVDHKTREFLVRQQTQLVNTIRPTWPSSGWSVPAASIMQIACSP